MKNKTSTLLIASVFVAGLCSIVYELLIATASSYFLGDSIKQFSITIGAYMAAMGVGSYLSRLFSDKYLLQTFIAFELGLALIGGLSVPLLYAAFAYTPFFQLFSIVLTLVIGLFIGLEIPFLSRLLEKHYSLKLNISTVLSVDYLGALIATLVFPFVLLPWLGTFKTSVFFGLINMSIAFLLLWGFSDKLSLNKKKVLWAHTGIVSIILVGTFFLANGLLSAWSNQLYTDRIIYTEETPYQQIVMTKNKNDVRLYLNGNLQFSSTDEYRYHESLVHLPLSLLEKPQHVLVLGGGDGLGVRELLKYPVVESITLIDLDPAIHALGKTNPQVVALNKQSLLDERVTLITEDAFKYLLNSKKQFDVIIIDLPDPNNPSLARLYSKAFYRLVNAHLTTQGVFVTQATSPFFAREAYWTIVQTIREAGFPYVLPYHVNVPSFGEWGFVMGAKTPKQTETITFDVETKYLKQDSVDTMLVFGKDIDELPMTASTLDKPDVLTRYLKGWQHWN